MTHKTREARNTLSAHDAIYPIYKTLIDTCKRVQKENPHSEIIDHIEDFLGRLDDSHDDAFSQVLSAAEDALDEEDTMEEDERLMLMYRQAGL